MKSLLNKFIPKKLNNRLATLGIAGLLAITPVSSAWAEEQYENTQAKEKAKIEEVKVEKYSPKVFGSVDFKNKYIGGSGKQFGDGDVTQVTAGVDLGKINLGVWGNYNRVGKKINETVSFVNVPIERKNFSLNIYGEIFSYPNSDFKENGKVEISISPKGLPLDLSVYAGQGFTNGLSEEAGRIFKLYLGKSIPVWKDIRFTPSVVLTARNEYFGSKTGISHGKLEGCLRIPLGKNLGLNLNSGYQHPIDEGKFPKVKNELTTGIGLSVKY